MIDLNYGDVFIRENHQVSVCVCSDGMTDGTVCSKPASLGYSDCETPALAPPRSRSCTRKTQNLPGRSTLAGQDEAKQAQGQGGWGGLAGVNHGGFEP